MKVYKPTDDEIIKDFVKFIETQGQRYEEAFTLAQAQNEEMVNYLNEQLEKQKNNQMKVTNYQIKVN